MKILFTIAALAVIPTYLFTQATPARAQTKQPQVVTYDKLLEYLKLEVKEEKLLRMLEESPTLFTLSGEQESELKQAGASEKVISAIKTKATVQLKPGDVTSFIVILDCSGSMMDNGADGLTKFTAAQKAVMDLVKAIPNGRELSFIVYGTDPKQKCLDVKVVLPLTTLNQNVKDNLIPVIEKLKAVGHTPIALSLQKASKEVTKAKGMSKVILITDGIETCHGDPEKEAAALADNQQFAGVDVIGLNLTAEESKAVAAIAKKGRGKYYDAQTAKDLQRAIAKVEEDVVIDRPKPVDKPMEDKWAPRVQVLFDRLTDEDIAVRVTAMRAFKSLTKEQVQESLEKALIAITKGNNEGVKTWAINELNELDDGWNKNAKGVTKMPNDGPKAIEKPMDNKWSPRVQIMFDNLGDADISKRIVALRGLKSQPKEQIYKAVERALIELSKSKNGSMRAWAVAELGDLDNGWRKY